MTDPTQSITNAAALRERAEHLRRLAGEYDPSVGRPLLEKAAGLEWEAARIERNGRERRQPKLSGRDSCFFPARPVFGRRGVAAD